MIAGFESLDTEFKHACAITNGIDELVLSIKDSKELTPDGVYADTVLKLNGIELAELAGTEGFLDGIKRGASKIYEWIKELIKTIRGWFNGSTKKDYEQAKKEITSDLILVNRIKELKAQGIDAYLKHDLDEGTVMIVKRMPTNVKKEVNDSLNTIKAVAVSTPTEINEAAIGTVLSTVANRVVTAMKSINLRIEEIQRIDPTGETLEVLGLSRDHSVIVDAVKGSGAYFAKMDQKDFSSNVKSLVKDSEAAQSELAKATVALDKMNEAAKGHEGTERSSQLSRSVSVVKNLAEIAGIYRDTVITINGQVMMAYKNAENSIIKQAVLEAMKNTDEVSNKYLNDAVAAL